MRETDHRLIKSTDPTDRTAVALLNGEKPVRVDITQVELDERIGAALTEASVSLAMAESIYAAGQHREAFKWSVRATLDLFQSAGAPIEQLAPLRHLFEALEDLDRGAVDQSLVPIPTKGRRPDPSTKWGARACVAAVMQIEMMLGADEARAATATERRAQKSQRPTLSRRTGDQHVMSWRKRFVEGTAPFGQVIFDTAIDMVQRLACHSKSKTEWEAALRERQRRLLDMAETRRSYPADKSGT